MNINICKGIVTVTQSDKIQEPELPIIKHRVIIESGPCPIWCPTGYFKRFGFCVPVNEDVSDTEYTDEVENNEME